MMPFLQESSSGSVTITPTNGSGGTDYLHKFVKQEGIGSRPSFSGENGTRVVNKVVRSLKPSIAEIQRKAEQRKLQIAKMMGHGGMGTHPGMKFQGHTQGMMTDYHNESLQSAAARRARSNNFTLNETFALLKIWASPEMQWQMKHNFRNFRVWEAISFAMQELGHDRTAIQCKNRIQNLTSIYYRIKKSKQDYRSFNFPYYKIIGDVLDGKKNGSNSTAPPPNMAEFLQHFTKSGAITISPTHGNSSAGSSSGMAAHMALVEEYQHLINGNPEVTLTPTGGRSSPSNGSTGYNVLSPEVSISEGDTPIRMDTQVIRSTNSAHKGSNSSSNRNSAMNGILTQMKGDQEDVAGDGSVPSENDHEGCDFDDGGGMYNSTDEETLAMLGQNYMTSMTSSAPSTKKRPSSSAFSKYGVSNGIPSKRPRGVSSATTASTSGTEDPVAQYLSDMVEIERQWLDMERERAENERQMMMYMMQILQALVCPEQEESNDGEANEINENDTEVGENENEYGEAEDQGEGEESQNQEDHEQEGSG